MSDVATCGRRCLACGAVEPLAGNGPIWRLGWRCSACARQVIELDGYPAFAPELADTIDGFDPKIFNRLAELESGHFWFVARNRLLVGLANKFFPDARSFLEVGCGTGFVLRAISESRKWQHIAGSELHPSGLVHARTRLPPEVELLQMDARDIPASGVFDLTGAFDVIEHIEEDERVLRSMRAATRLGGGTIIAVPQHPWLWSRTDEIAHHQRRYRRGELEAKLQRNGFEVLFSTSYTATLLPAMAASRFISRGRADDADEFEEFTLSPGLNRFFTAVLNAEVAMTLRGWPWPAGGSRVTVARAV